MFRHQIIQDILLEAKECADKIDLTIEYKGVVFAEQISIVKVSKYYSAFEVSSKMAAALKHTPSITLLYNKYGSKMIQAKFLEVDKDNRHIVNLYHFKLIDKVFIPEFSLRVIPNNNFFLEIEDSYISDKQIKIADLSKEALAFFIDDKEGQLYKDRLLHLRFKFRMSNVHPFVFITNRARVIRVDEKNAKQRVAVSFTMSKDDYKLYCEYIASQEKAIRKSFEAME